MLSKRIFIVIVLSGMLVVLPAAGSQAADPTSVEASRPATPAELGFSGTRSEIREQAAEFTSPGNWGKPDPADVAAVKEMAQDSQPLALDDPFRLSAHEIKDFNRAMNEKPSAEPDSVLKPRIDLSPELDLDGGNSFNDLPMGLTLPANCRTSGHRIKLVYAYPEGYTPTEPWEALQTWTAVNGANLKFALESSYSSDMDRMTTLYVDCYPPGHPLAGYPTITWIEVPPQNETTSLWDSLKVALPFPEDQAAIRNLVFYAESDPRPPAASAGGYAQSFNHSRAAGLRTQHAASVWNQSTLSAVIFREYWLTHVVIHELLHTFGAVNAFTPLALGGSGGGHHCVLAFDVMCYDDTGENSHLYPIWGCPGQNSPATVPLDCLKQAYFRGGHGHGLFLDAWLDTHWNTIGAENRFVKATPPWDYTVPCNSC